MASIACASSLILNKGIESRNGSSLFQFNGLKAVETMQVGSTKFESKGLVSNSGTFAFLLYCLFFYSVLHWKRRINVICVFILLLR